MPGVSSISRNSHPFIGIMTREINKLSGNFRNQPADSLLDAKKRYLKQAAVMDGLTDDATRQNYRLMRVLQSAGNLLCQQMPNDVYAMFVKGSRVKGYHSLDSDIDLYFVIPESSKHKGIPKYAEGVINREITRDGLYGVKADTENSFCESGFDEDDFIYSIERARYSYNAFFGFSLVSNPNLLLAQLTCLEVLLNLDWRDDLWEGVRKRYRADYLEVDNGKLAERLGINRVVVDRKLDGVFYRERYNKFDLPGYRRLMQMLLNKYQAFGEARLKGYKMYGVYQSVAQQLRSGY